MKFDSYDEMKKKRGQENVFPSSWKVHKAFQSAKRLDEL